MASPASSSFEDEFCTQEDSSIENCVQYLHQELQSLGLPPVLAGEGTGPDTVRLINAAYRLLQLHRYSLRSTEELKESLQRAKSDVTFCQETQARLKEDLKAAQREIAAVEERERQLTQKNRALSSRLRTEQEEVRRLKLSLQYKDTQFAHESKKREKEYERLKQKLGQLMSDKSQERKLGMSILNSLQRADGKRRTWSKPGSSDEEMYRVVVSNYEERQKELMVENGSLRESLATVQRELVSLLNQRQARRQEPSTPEMESDSPIAPGLSDELLSSGHFQMPFDIVRDGIEQSFRGKCQRVKERMEELRERIEKLESDQIEGVQVQDRDSAVQQLEDKLADFKEIIEQQETLLEKSAEKEVQRSLGLLNESQLWQERERLDGERELFHKQRDTFERERHKYLEAARRLDRERLHFEDDKAAFLREQFLDASILNSTKDLDSFYSQLCSTPATAAPRGDHSALGGSPSLRPRQTLEQNTSDVDLQHDLSLCSDDGLNVLNERYETAIECEAEGTS